MREKFKAFWSAHRLLLVTVFTIIVALIGGYLILVSAKTHVEFWPAIGSWVGGVATVYAVSIAIIEYKNRKRLDGAYELADFGGLVGNELYISWYEFCHNQIRTNSLKKLYVKDEESYSESYLNSLNRTSKLHLEFMKYYNQASVFEYRLRLISPNKSTQVHSEIHRIGSFLKDFSEYSKVMDFSCVDDSSQTDLSDFRRLSDEISKKDYRGSIVEIAADQEWKDYLKNAQTSVFKPLLAKLKTIN